MLFDELQQANLRTSTKDVEDFEAKYGINLEEYRDNPNAMYDTDAYKASFDKYKADRDAD